MKIQTKKRFLNKNLKYFSQASKKYRIKLDILLGIAILEDMNRPSIFRILERTFHYILPIRTFGLMQVHSEKPLTDKESIFLAAKLLSKFPSKNPLKIGEFYNGSKEYGLCLRYILDELHDTK